MDKLARACAILLLCWIPAAAAQSGGPVVVLTQSGAIGPANADYLHRGITAAAKLDASLIVLRMDTPGGLDLAMRSIIRDILASPVPVATYVAPAGARAASAGTYILYASHIAAMAPATNLGAATPVRIGPSDHGQDDGRPESPGTKPSGKSDKPSQIPGGDTLARKQVNDAAAYIRGLAQLRGRNADWAEKAVREAVSLSAREALALKVIDVMADDLPQLLKQIDGRKVSAAGGEIVLSTAAAQIVMRDPDWRTELLAVITNPGIAYLLLLAGIYGLFFEFMNPGMALPGVFGGIALLLALFALQLLPVNYVGLALIALGVALLASEFFTGASGVLGGGGLLAFVAGSIMLIDTDASGYAVPLPLVGGVALAAAAGLLIVGKLAFTARGRPIVSGREYLIGATGVMLDFKDESYASVQGETWKVRSGRALQAGERVRVTAIDGLVLEVEPEKKE
jgi:membrane-bound serine protease (ClpP class)